jgi:GDP-L-fucose synthase
MDIRFGLYYSVNEYYKVVAKTLDLKVSWEHDLSKPPGMKQKLNAIDCKKMGWVAQTSRKIGIKKISILYRES